MASRAPADIFQSRRRSQMVLSQLSVLQGDGPSPKPRSSTDSSAENRTPPRSRVSVDHGDAEATGLTPTFPTGRLMPGVTTVQSRWANAFQDVVMQQTPGFLVF